MRVGIVCGNKKCSNNIYILNVYEINDKEQIYEIKIKNSNTHLYYSTIKCISYIHYRCYTC